MAGALILHLKVDMADLDILKQGGFNLCLTRDVKYGAQELKGNVVFSMIPTKGLAPTMVLRWEEEKFQVYETLQLGEKVQAGTMIADIEGGQEADFDRAGNYKLHGVPEPGQPFRVGNGWQNQAHVGVKIYDYGTFFISPKVPLHSTSALLPRKNYGIFWDMKLETDTIFDHTSTEPYQFSHTDDSQIMLEYKNGVWSTLK
ncbi:hypothetical protein BYT27DRAFT_7200283 [Phlegmacium glaucopus]|nr:hypothetical protein BYT27DRAFT_7200283 [Phlegmacium glaucopus]